MIEHTPGPWQISAEDESAIYQNGGAGLVAAAYGNPKHRGADARLIATAPDLLEVSELALAFHGADTEAFVARYGHGMTTKELCDRIRAVIAKVEGRDQ